MKVQAQILAAMLASGSIPALAQYLPSYQNNGQQPAQNTAEPLAVPAPTRPAAQQTAQPITPPAAQIEPLPIVAPGTQSDSVARLTAFRKSDVKFSIDELADILQDKRHEGWILTAYPDPRTAQPLIGAGFSLDLPEREHPQTDPANPHLFLEPSSAELWQAAGLEPARLQTILATYNQRLDEWGKEGFRKRMRTLDPQINETDAQALTRIGIIQAAINARAYCRYFDTLTAAQQMGMTQLVYQMGVNMREFTTFLGLMNHETTDELGNVTAFLPGPAYWHDVQMSLINSRWAHLYRDRATAVVAMFDPRYEVNSAASEHKVNAVLNPPRRRGRGSRAHLRNTGLKKPPHAATRRRSIKKRGD